MGRVARFAAAIVFTSALAVIAPIPAQADDTSGPGVKCILCWPGWEGPIPV